MIKNSSIIRILQLFLRFFAIGGKFLLVIILGKNLSIEDFADFSLFTVTVVIFTFVLGFEFHTYSNRYIIKTNKIAFAVKNSFIFYLFIYFFSMPIVISLSFFDLISTYYLPVFIFILAIEHVLSEFERLFVALLMPLRSSISLLLRSGLWCYFLFGILFFIDKINLDIVFTLWGIGCLSALFYCVFVLKNLNIKFSFGWDKKWIISGVKVALPFLISSLLIRLFFTLDRYFIKWFGFIDNVAIYSFFMNFANILLIVSGPLISVFLYPKLVKSYNNNNINEMMLIKSQFYKQIAFFSFLTVLVVIIFIEPVLYFVDKDYLIKNKNILYLQLFALFVYNLSITPHYILYSASKDKILLNSTIYSFLLFVILAYLLTFAFSVMFSIAISQVIAFFVMFLIKLYYSNKTISNM